jgi:folate-binding protein YgfZ
LPDQLRAARLEGGLYQLPPRLLVRLSGKDAFRYLHGQVTRDLNRLGEKEALPACLLTPKGKLCAPLLIRREGEDLLIEADPSLEESLLARLDRYIVADEVTLSVEPAREMLHCFGEAFKTHLGVRVSRLGVPGVDLETITGAALLDRRLVETLRIERGIPAWGKEMSEETLPPEVGLDRTHIDYDRGCYPGQETISRLKSIGRVRRLLHTLRSSLGAPLHPGMRVLDAEKKELGEITSAAEQWDSGSWVALALLPRETAGPLFALDPSVPLTGETTPISILTIHGS